MARASLRGTSDTTHADNASTKEIKIFVLPEGRCLLLSLFLGVHAPIAAEGFLVACIRLGKPNVTIASGSAN